MKTFFLPGLASIALFLSQPVQAGGVAICIEIGQNAAGQFSDKNYFLKSSSEQNASGASLRIRAREAFEQLRDGGTNFAEPYCRDSGTFKSKGFWVVIRGNRSPSHGQSHTRWALGYGANKEAALSDAFLELSRVRDNQWSKDQHGYIVVEEGTW